jgi:hypothetical protein
MFLGQDTMGDAKCTRTTAIQAFLSKRAAVSLQSLYEIVGMSVFSRMCPLMLAWGKRLDFLPPHIHTIYYDGCLAICSTLPGRETQLPAGYSP